MSPLFKKARPPVDPAENAWPTMSTPCKNGHHCDASPNAITLDPDDGSAQTD